MHELYRVTKYYNKPELHPSFMVKCYSVMHFNLKGETVTFMILSGGGGGGGGYTGLMLMP